MSQKNNASKSKSGLTFKKGGGLVLALALLILAINFVLTQRGTPLPRDVTDLAQDIVDEAAQPPPTFPHTESAEEIAPKTVSQANPDTPSWPVASSDFDYYTLALSWEPAFCESKPHNTECVSQTDDRYDATNFVLHGLWPNIENDEKHTFSYCNLDRDLIRQDERGDWCDLPQLDLSTIVWEDLTVLMPGTVSCLHHHEWYKHGTCAGMVPDDYFALSTHLVQLFAQTDFSQYVVQHIGQTMTRQNVLTRFDTEFGAGTNTFLSLRCNKLEGTSLLTELRIVIRKDIKTADDFADVLPAEKVFPQGNCPAEFKIDRAGLDNF